MRIDKLLWHLRFTKTRALAQALVAQGHVRRNGARVLRASQDCGPGDTLTIPLPVGVRVVALDSLPVRRGPAAEAQSHYRVLDPPPPPRIAAAEQPMPGRGQPQ